MEKELRRLSSYRKETFFDGKHRKGKKRALLLGIGKKGGPFIWREKKEDKKDLGSRSFP